MSTNIPMVVNARLPMPRGLDGIDERKWRVLVETTFPTARTPEAVVMAIDYCRARGLDVFKKPVHIVPMWNSSLGREVETVWPGINEIQITAARTGAWAGMDEPRWGPEIKRSFKGRKKDRGNWIDAEIEISFPEWCAVTVYRIVGGVRSPFTEPVFWLEAYSRAGGKDSELPTDMWVRRPRGQLHKVAKASALRAAFPEEAEYVAEEMEGKEVEAGGVVIEARPIPPASAPLEGEAAEPKRPSVPSASPAQVDTASPHNILHGDPSLNTPEKWTESFIARIAASTSIDEVAEWDLLNSAALGKIHASYPALYKQIEIAVTNRQNDLSNPGGSHPPVAGTAPAVKRPPSPRAAGATNSDGMPDYKIDANSWIEWADKVLATVTDAADLESVFNEKIEPHRGGLFPPDQDALLSIYGRHERRLGID